MTVFLAIYVEIIPFMSMTSYIHVKRETQNVVIWRNEVVVELKGLQQLQWKRNACKWIKLLQFVAVIGSWSAFKSKLGTQADGRILLRTSFQEAT